MLYLYLFLKTKSLNKQNYPLRIILMFRLNLFDRHKHILHVPLSHLTVFTFLFSRIDFIIKIILCQSYFFFFRKFFNFLSTVQTLRNHGLAIPGHSSALFFRRKRNNRPCCSKDRPANVFPSCPRR